MSTPQGIAGKAYQENLRQITRVGAITGALFELTFALIYLANGMPAQIVWTCVSGFVISLIGYALMRSERWKNAGAHLVTFAIFLTLTIPGLLTGGIRSSSMVWLTFIPAAAIIMAGASGGIVWGVISILTAAIIYYLNVVAHVNWTLIPSTDTDRLTDLAFAILAMTLASWLSEWIRANAYKKLEGTEIQLRHLATTDPLTEVFNRRYFIEQTGQELDRAQKNGQVSTLIMIDVDHFKTINDTYGHAVGDQILSSLVQVFRSHLREKDIIGRLGGDEFIFLLPETSLKKAEIIVSRLFKMIAKSQMQTSAGPIPVTISAGISATRQEENISIDLLLSQADRAMYQAKKIGRNAAISWREA